MKILYYHQYFQTRNSAGGTRSYEFSKRLLKHGHQVTIVCAKNSSEQLSLNDYIGHGYRKGDIEGIQIIQFDLISSNKSSFIKRILVFLKFAIKGTRFAFAENYDVLFATSTPLTIGIPGIILKFFKRKSKFVFEVRDLWPELPKAMGIIKSSFVLRVLEWIEKLTYKSADGCIGLSPGIINGIAKTGYDPSKIILVPNGCDLDLFTPGKQYKNIIPGCSENSFIAVFAGAHGLANGLEYVLDVAQILKREKINDIKIVLVGDGSRKSDLIERASQQNLDNCIFLDPVPKHQLVKIFQAADVGMMILADVPAFSYGTSPNKFFDYISSGLPVLVNHYGWVADMLSEHSCGYVSDPKKPKEFADNLVELSHNSSLCDEMGKNSRRLAESEFSREKLAEKWINFVVNI